MIECINFFTPFETSHETPEYHAKPRSPDERRTILATAQRRQTQTDLPIEKGPGCKAEAQKGPPGRCERGSADVSGRGVFMEELLAELEQRNVSFQSKEVGKKEGQDNDS